MNNKDIWELKTKDGWVCFPTLSSLLDHCDPDFTRLIFRSRRVSPAYFEWLLLWQGPESTTINWKSAEVTQ